MGTYDFDQMTLFDYLRQPFKIKGKIRLIELFAGVGSQAMALRDIGADFEHYRVCEFDKYAVASYNAIHGTDFDTTDIRDLKGADLGIEETDKYTYIMTYSFPCQDLSIAGKMRGMTKGSGTRSGLLWEVERLLNETEKLPQVLLMENVPQVHSEDNMPDFKAWMDFLTSKGYVNYWQDLNAKDYGVAQNRYRCFMVSLLGEYNFKFPKTVPLKKVMKDYLEDNVDEKYYITSEKAKMLIDTLIQDGKILTEQNRTEQNRLCVDGTIFEPGVRNTANCIKARYDAGICKHRKEHTGVIEVEKMDVKLIGNMDHTLDNTFESTNRVYSADGLCPTIPTGTGGGHMPKILDVEVLGGFGEKKSNNGTQYYQQDRVYSTDTVCPALNSSGEQLVPKIVETEKVPIGDENKFSFIYEIDGAYYRIRIRKLTPRECWRLMGFTDEDYEKAESVNSNTQLYKEAGNSIVKNVLMAIFGQMIGE